MIVHICFDIIDMVSSNKDNYKETWVRNYKKISNFIFILNILLSLDSAKIKHDNFKYDLKVKGYRSEVH